MPRRKGSIRDLRTIGELRAYLKETNAGWFVDPKLKDSDPIPRGRTGGRIKRPRRPRPMTPEELISHLNKRTANSLLNQRRAAQGLIESASSGSRPQPRIVPGGQMPSGFSATLPTPPPSVDWRQRFGWPWITSMQDQENCDLCWAFAAAALIESMVRIEHCVWFKGSENEMVEGVGGSCNTEGGDDHAINWAIQNGLCDEQCEPYSTTNFSASPCADSSGRSVLFSQPRVAIPPSSPSSNPNYQMQKVWLDLNGPIDVWLDANDGALQAMSGGVYDYTSSSYTLDHFVTIVGYDDTVTYPSGSGAWICKNSWGPQWNGDGFFYLAYGAAGSNLYGHSAIYDTNADPWSKRRLHNGSLLESGNGNNHMNFESLMVPGDGSLLHYSRDNDAPPFPWTAGESVPCSDAVAVGWPALTETTYNRNLEVVYTAQGQSLHHWWRDQSGVWHDGGIFGPVNTIGAPGFVQSNYGMPGNFEVVVLDGYQQLQHWTRDSQTLQWQLAASFGGDVGFSGAALVQSHYGTQGNFELVCVLSNGRMQHWFMDNDAANPSWAPTTTFGSNITSAPCMIEGNYGAASEYAVGNFELCVASGGYLQHWYRQNDGDMQWHGPTTFGDGHETSVVGLVQSSFGFNLEVLAARDDGHIQHYWRDSASLEWHVGEIVL